MNNLTVKNVITCPNTKETVEASQCAACDYLCFYTAFSVYCRYEEVNK